MAEVIAIESKGENLKDVLASALERADECDHIVILMQKKKGGILWLAPDSMRLETMVFLLWSALLNFVKV
jgi:hypothetical protein